LPRPYIAVFIFRLGAEMRIEKLFQQKKEEENVMDFNLKGKVVGITGSAGGIGKELAEGFAQEGCKLILCDINAEKMQETKEEFEKKGYEVYCEQVGRIQGKRYYPHHRQRRAALRKA
jgi:FlaA1/EpsC-like NDP-sugar epimerase